ncbi:hypothetical protein NVP1193O_247 [Vibrio phage 1.193.O._10N.286.52.C6]|nr:hypothetical protein NVP1193O_247 [Vibrio phage 1.193.O._10N.286.52.C6]
MIYIVKLSNENETLLKLGFTSKNTTYNRFQSYKSKFDKVELLHTFLEESKYNLKLLEKDLNTVALLPYKIDPITDFGGFSECYPIEKEAFLVSEVTSRINNTRYSIVEDTTYGDIIGIPSVEVDTTLFRDGAFKSLNSEDVDIFDIEALFETIDYLTSLVSPYNRAVIKGNCDQYRKALRITTDQDLVIMTKEEFKRLQDEE